MGVVIGHAKVKLKGFSVVESMALLKLAVMILVFVATPSALDEGVTTVTIGRKTGPMLPVPRTGACPPPPQATTTVLRSVTANHGEILELHSIFFIRLPLD
jgi:hypothetical protein